VLVALHLFNARNGEKSRGFFGISTIEPFGPCFENVGRST
jgi:hypothetical protein